MIGDILAQPSDKKIAHLNVYVNRKLNKAKRNHSTTKREGLAMIFALQKFQHYLLANPFAFFIDNQAMKYLVNKPIHQGRICWWLTFSRIWIWYYHSTKQKECHPKSPVLYICPIYIQSCNLPNPVICPCNFLGPFTFPVKVLCDLAKSFWLLRWMYPSPLVKVLYDPAKVLYGFKRWSTLILQRNQP